MKGVPISNVDVCNRANPKGYELGLTPPVLSMIGNPLLHCVFCQSEGATMKLTIDFAISSFDWLNAQAI